MTPPYGHSVALSLELPPGNTEVPLWIALPCPKPGSRPWLLRNDEITALRPLAPARETIFTGCGGTSLDFAGDDLDPTAGEGARLLAAGSSDDDDALVEDFASGGLDPDPTVAKDASRPLVFYQVTLPVTTLYVTKADDRIRLSW